MKRSSQVALLLMGTAAIGGSAYAFMRSENCADRPGMSAPGSQQATDCARRSGSSSSSGSYRSYGGSSSSSAHNPSGNSGSASHSGIGDSGSHTTTRGGFGSFAHSFTSHFSGGG